MAKEKTKAYAFLDTNIFLQFRDFDSIDWPTLLGFTEVCLVVAPIVSTELEGFKYDQNSQRRQGRSRSIVKKINEIVFAVPPGKEGPVKGRRGVTLLLLTESANANLYSGLVAQNNDDQLIASILKFMGEQLEIAGNLIILVSDDSGILNKARSRNIGIHFPEDSLRLPDETSADQRKIKQLEQALESLRNKEPKLTIAFPSTDTFVNSFNFGNIENSQVADKNELSELVEIETNATILPPPTPPQPANRIFGTTEFNMFTSNSFEYFKEDIEKYEKERQDYLEHYKSYLMSLAYFEKCKRLKSLSLVVLNNGTVPADKVIVSLILPEGFSLSRLKKISSIGIYKPKKPSRPIQPKPGVQLHSAIFDSLYNNREYHFYPYNDSMIGNINGNYLDLEIKKHSNNTTKIEWSVGQLLHNRPIPLQSIWLEFPLFQGEQRFELRYQIYAANVSEIVTGSIELIANNTVKPFHFKDLR